MEISKCLAGPNPGIHAPVGSRDLRAVIKLVTVNQSRLNVVPPGRGTGRWISGGGINADRQWSDKEVQKESRPLPA